MRPRSRHLTACLLLLVLGPGPVLAEEPCPQVDHRVEARVEGDLVHLTVLRTLRNPSPRHAKLYDGFPLPREGTVHGFALEAQGQWTEGRLLETSEAHRQYEALRRRGTAAPRTVALLTASGEGVDLHLWNVPPRASVTVRYDVRLRPTYAHGRSSFTYPLMSSERSLNASCEKAPRPVLTLAPPSPDADIRMEEKEDEHTREVLAVSWEPHPFEGIEARAGFAPWSAGTLGFVQLRAAKHLEAAPERARVLFVVDASHSVGPGGISRQLERAGDVLALLPDASVEVVLFRRSAERLFGRFIPAAEWKTALAALPATRLAPGNGSHLDEGLRLAQRVLTEGSGPVRVIALTDGQLRRAYAPAAPAPTTSAPDAAVHLLSLYHRRGSAASHAMLSGPLVQESCGTHLPPHADTLEPLVRPTRLEHVRLEDEQGSRLKELGTLERGAGFQLWLPELQTPPRQLVLRGQRWGCPSSTPVELAPSLSADVGRMAHAWRTTSRPRPSGEAETLPCAEALEQLAAKGDWLSPTRSFLVVPPGAGPSSARTRALPDDGVEGGVVGGVMGGVILCPLAPRPPREDSPRFAEELTRLLQAATASCPHPLATSPFQVRVETTGDEIVDVEVTGTDSEAQATCVREATWAIRLPCLFDDGHPASYTLTPRR